MTMTRSHARLSKYAEDPSRQEGFTIGRTIHGKQASSLYLLYSWEMTCLAKTLSVAQQVKGTGPDVQLLKH
jgi:hypothetical protein